MVFSNVVGIVSLMTELTTTRREIYLSMPLIPIKNGKTVVPSIAFSVFFNCNHIFVKPDLIKGTTV